MLCVRWCVTTLVSVALAAAAMADDYPPLPTDFGKCPRQTEEFAVHRPAAGGRGAQRRGLERKGPALQPTPRHAEGRSGHDLRRQPTKTLMWPGWRPPLTATPGAAFTTTPTSAAGLSRCWTASSAAAADGVWDDGGLDGFFGPHSLAWATLEWIETGDVDPACAAAWRQAVAKAADQGLLCLHYGPYRPSVLTGQYANPEMYLLSGLAAAWKLTGQQRYRDEAAKALRRYDAWLFDGGGAAYFVRSRPSTAISTWPSSRSPSIGT